MTSPAELKSSFSLAEFQSLIQQMYSSKDEARGVDGTFMWLMEEIGELAAALRTAGADESSVATRRADLAAEFADVLAWLVTIANVAEVDLQQAVWEKYGRGCPGCGELECRCDDGAKP